MSLEESCGACRRPGSIPVVVHSGRRLNEIGQAKAQSGALTVSQALARILAEDVRRRGIVRNAAKTLRLRK